MAIDDRKQLRAGSMKTNEAMQDIYCIASPSVTYKITPSASTDPFSGKTNKYAESKVVEITTIGAGCHVVFGGSGVGAATTDDYLIPSGGSRKFLVDSDAAYVRIIQNTTTATVFVTELY